jgi:hypothetical protein
VVVSPFSAPVLGGAALVTAPSWWNALQGTSPATDAVTRFLVCIAICWVALELLAAFVGPAPHPAAPADAAEEMADQAPPG